MARVLLTNDDGSLYGAPAEWLGGRLEGAQSQLINTGPALVLDVNKGAAPMSTKTIPMVTYDGSGQITHSSVVYRPRGWAGHRYWLASTPYPNDNDDLENPSIWYSDNGDDWTAIPGNPIEPYPGIEGTYNSDPHLVFGPDDVLYCFWRADMGAAVGSATAEQFYYRTSTDGLNWSERVLSMVTDNTVSRLLSPAIRYREGVWHWWAVQAVGTAKHVIEHHTATDPAGPWTKQGPVTISPALPDTREPWHLDVQEFEGMWYCLLNDTNNGTSGVEGDLYLMSSFDGENWKRGTTPVIQRKGFVGDMGDPGSVRIESWYRSCITPAVRNGVFGFELWATTIGNAKKFLRTFISFLDTDRTAVETSRRIDLLEAIQGHEPWVLGDSFNRTTIGSAPTGQAWTVNAGTAALSGGTLSTATDANLRLFVNLGISDYETNTTIKFPFQAGSEPAGSLEVYVLARVIDGVNFLRFGVRHNYWVLQRVTANTVTQLGPRRGLPFRDGEPVRLGLRCVGDQITCLVNGEVVQTVTEAQGAGTATQAGLQTTKTVVKFHDVTAKRIV